jgi:hypothetical protein
MEALTVRKILNLLVVILLVVTAAAINASAQNAPAGPAPIDTQLVATAGMNGPTLPTNAARTQAIVNSLSSLPEADNLIYINPQRILNEVLPKFLSAKDVEDMRKGFDDVKKTAGIDPTKIDYLVVTVRFRKPTADLNFQPPEFMVVSSGDFSAEALLGMARMASQGKLRDEKYGDKTIGLITIDPLARESEKNPLLKSFVELGIVSLNANTIAAGSPGYLRAAIDAEAGKDRISPANLNSLMRDPNALISFAGRPWHSFAQSFGMLGTETTPRAPRCESNIGDMYAALTMDGTNFMVRGVSNADNPDTAKILANLYTTLLRYATNSIKDASAQQLLNGLAITAEGDEVMMRADFPQQMVVDLIQKQMKPKPIETTDVSGTGVATPKPTVKRRRTRRRH